MRLLLSGLLLVVGCDDIGRIHANMTPAPDMAPSGPATPINDGRHQIGPDGCSDAAKLVYLIDETGELLNFAPDKLTFTDLGSVPCDAPSFNSMAIDRSAVAWVNSADGHVFRVNTQAQPLDCQSTAFDELSGFGEFGMGFSSNSVGSTDETLFIAGPQSFGSNGMAKLDTTTMKTRLIGTLGSSWPELTGTGSAELWGFFPDVAESKIAQIDKKTAALKLPTLLPQLNGTQKAWAFAFWGGSYWIFLQRYTDPSTNIWQVSFDETGTHVIEAKHNIGRNIVGAGVSTCAPLQQPG